MTTLHDSLMVNIAYRYVHTISINSSCVGTKTIPDRASVHTYIILMWSIM